MTSVFYVFLAAVLGGFIHRFRGGWPDKPNWLPGHTRLWSSLFVILLLLIILRWEIAVAIGLAYLFGSTFGWHNWMNCGDPITYKLSTNIKWVDYLVYKICGPYWIPSSAENDKLGELAELGFSVKSPTGDVRDVKWRAKAACIGMALRGLYYVPMFLILPIFYNDPMAALPAVVIILLAPIYGGARALWIKTKDKINYRDDSLTIAEPVVGVIFGLALGVQLLLLGLI